MPLPGLAISWITNGLAQSMLLICKLTNPEPDLSQARTPQEAVFLCLNYSSARYQATRDFPYSLNPAQIDQTSQS